MTRLLDEIFSQVSKLSEDDQDEVARWLLEELKSERRWSELLEGSGSALSRLADEAIAEHRRGETEELDPQKL